MRKLPKMAFVVIVASVLAALAAQAGTFPYTKQPIPRDLILEICHLYYGIHWRCDPENAYGTSIPQAECPYGTTSGWKDTVPYCWAGADEIYEYLEKMTAGKGAGDKDTSSTNPYYSGLVGSVDCSGFASQCFRSGRYTTSTFHNVATNLPDDSYNGWTYLAPADAINNPGSHIRMCEKYPTETGLILVYESTGFGWRLQHRLLAYDNNYKAIRYNYTTPLPSILDAVRTNYGEVTLTWFGAATTGFRVYQSADGSAWARVMDEAQLDPDADTAVIRDLDPNRLYLFRIVAVNGTSESGPSSVFPVRLSELGKPPVLLVHAYDRWLRQQGGTAFNDFLIRYATALDRLNVNFDTCDNFRITRAEINLSDYAAVIWMVGEESTGDYTLNFLEELEVQAFLRQGGRLFISGSEIGWDLVQEESAIDNLDVDDSDFYRDFLKAEYVEDDAGTYSVSGLAGTLFEGLSFNFDDGTHGTYDPDYPDVLAAAGGSTACLTYGGSDYAAVQYSGPFVGGSTEGKVVYLGFPYETIYPESAREAVMERVIEFFNLVETPEPPVLLCARAAGASEASLEWALSQCEQVRVYQSEDGAAWSEVETLSATSTGTTVGGLSQGGAYYFKLTALQGGNESADSDVLGVMLGGSAAAPILLVEGHDRWMAERGVSHDFVVRFGEAIEAYTGQAIAFDSCANDVVKSGQVALDGYEALIWTLGEESSLQRTFNDVEQQQLAAYLDGGGNLFVSGSDVGWDLVEEGTAADQAFFQNYLRAAYVDDDAHTYSVVGVGGTIFDGLSFSFDDGTQGSYDVRWPEQLTAWGGSVANLAYSGGDGDYAGVEYANAFRLVYLGFPFETMVGSAERNDVMAAVLDFLLKGSEVPAWQAY